MLDIHSLMTSLASRRPIFHSEADFQHALAWQIHETRPDCDVRLELDPFPADGGRTALDIWAKLPEETVAIELKYTTRQLQQESQSEYFVLQNYAAGPRQRYAFLKDIQRLEYALQTPNPADYGFAILLTNSPTYWTPPRNPNTTDAAFRIHEGQRLSEGELRWGESASAGTRKDREDPIQLAHSYA